MPANDRASANEQQRRWYNAHKSQHIAAVRKYQQEVREWFRGYKATVKCRKCAESHYACIDFHHRDPKQKMFAIHKSRRCSLPALKRELEKCDPLCANCHRKLHHDEALTI